MSVLDASLFAEALTASTPLGEAARQRVTATHRWHAPAILPAEVLSAVRGLVLAGALSEAAGDRAGARLDRTRVTLHPFRPFSARVWELRANVTTYDGWYVALAERLDAPLVTTDARLARAAAGSCDVELVGA